MARYDLEYDRSYGLGYRRTGRRGMEGRGTTRHYEPRHMRHGGYGEYMGREEFGYRGGPERYRREPGMRRGMYAEYGQEYTGMGGYGREYRKSRWQTDYGDPFHDRERGTPVRMIHGEYQGYGGEYMGYGGEYGYGEEYTSRGRMGRYRRGAGWQGARRAYGGGYGTEYRGPRNY